MGELTFETPLIDTLCEIEWRLTLVVCAVASSRGRKRVLNRQPSGPNPLYHRNDEVDRRHVSLNSLFQVALYLPSQRGISLGARLREVNIGPIIILVMARVRQNDEFFSMNSAISDEYSWSDIIDLKRFSLLLAAAISARAICRTMHNVG